MSNATGGDCFGLDFWVRNGLWTLGGGSLRGCGVGGSAPVECADMFGIKHAEKDGWEKRWRSRVSERLTWLVSYLGR